jgi:hypothetical protein
MTESTTPQHAHNPSAARAPHHYTLAHLAFRGFCSQEPLTFFGVMGSPQRDSLIEEIWRQVCENCADEGEPDFDINEVQVITCLIKHYPCMVIQMPPPQEIGEAHFAGIVLHTDVNAPDLPKDPEFAYLTLEKGLDDDGEECTYFCAWTPDDEHVNYGQGPEASLENFIKQLEAMD